LGFPDLDKLAKTCVRNGRVDILNGCLNRLEEYKLYHFYESTVGEITNLASDPGYDIKLAKDLITETLQLVKNSTPLLYEFADETSLCYPSGLRLALLSRIVSRDKNPQLMSLFEFMFTEYRRAGIVIRKDEALEIAANHEYEQLLQDNLQD
jgi:hypothetical protein